jgi:hypothetical protein
VKNYNILFNTVININQIKWSWFRFLDPLINGKYPKTMQDIVKDRLPSFTPEQAKLVKGSSDCFGINQYTTYYISDKQTPQQAPTSYLSDWSVQYNCELPTYFSRSMWFYMCHCSFWRPHHLIPSRWTLQFKEMAYRLDSWYKLFLLTTLNPSFFYWCTRLASAK